MQSFSSSKQRGAIVFLHGSGDSGPGISAWLSSVSPDFVPSLSRAGIQVVFPSAPSRPYTLSGGAPSTVWHDRKYLALDAPEDAAGLAATRAEVTRIVESLVAAGVPLGGIAVGGFSMGGGTAVHTCLTGRGGGAKNLLNGVGGVFCMSSFVTSKSELWSDMAARGGPFPPVLFMHGMKDPMIAPAWAADTSERIRGCGASVECFGEEGVAHEPGPKSLQVLGEWLAKIINK